MKKILVVLILGNIFSFLLAPRVEAKLKIVSTTPDFAAIAQEIGRDRVEVTSLAKGTQDPHFIDAKPSFIRQLNQADVLIEGGIDLEVGWLPVLLDQARNSKILTGGSGRINASKGVHLLELPTGPIDRSEGDVHPQGNPHYMLDPENGKIVADQVASTLCRLDGGSCPFYRERLSSFQQRLDQKISEWKQAMAPYRGTPIVTYHKSWTYFAERFGLNIVGYVEPKPGIPPSPSHLAGLIELINGEKARLLFMEPYFSDQAPQFLAKKTGITVLALFPSVSPERGIDSYFDLFDQDISKIAAALKKRE